MILANEHFHEGLSSLLIDIEGPSLHCLSSFHGVLGPGIYN